MSTLLANAPADPATLFAEEADDLMLEAKNWLDGEPVENEAQADAISALVNRARRIAKDADEARKAEKRPHDDAAKAVQAKWKPTIDKAELAAETGKKALAPYLNKIDEANRAAAEAARAEADRLAELAREKHQGAGTDLTAAEDAERLLKVAAGAEREASKAEKAKAHATGGERAIGLVDAFTPVLTDAAKALAHYRAERPALLKNWLTDQAKADVRAGSRSIPGFEINHERKAR